jgi:hypothetical protein
MTIQNQRNARRSARFNWVYSKSAEGVSGRLEKIGARMDAHFPP